MKKLLAILLAVTMLVTVSAFGLSAYDIGCTGLDNVAEVYCGGSCYDYNTQYTQANSWNYNPNGTNGAQLWNWDMQKEWLDLGPNFGDAADCYSDLLPWYANGYVAAGYFSYYCWSNTVR